MKIEKRSLCTMNMPYAIGGLSLGTEQCVVGATEDHGPIMLVRPPYREATELVPGPGGCMSLLADRERPGELYAIMGCFLGYKFQSGGVYRIRRSEGAAESGWAASRVIDLPFAHRIELVKRGSQRYLIAASLASDKRDPADWSKTGTLYAAKLPGSEGEAWAITPILEGIHKNHGLLVTRFQGSRSILVSGSEGLFVIDLERQGETWTPAHAMSQEISEIAVFDLDGDGQDELVTIEPFHGNLIRIYKTKAGAWSKVWESGLEYGHCLLAGTVLGQPAVLVSNRSGGRSLLLFQFAPGSSGSGRGFPEPTQTVLDPAAGAANMLIVNSRGTDLVFSTNQAAGEIVVYSLANEGA